MKTRPLAAHFSFLCVILAVLLLASCASHSTAFEVAFCAPALDTNFVDDVGISLTGALPQLNTEDQAPIFSYVLAGDIPDDPLTGATGQSKITGMLMAQELDVMIATPDVARVQAVNELFMPLSEFFTVEELKSLSGRTIKYEFSDIINGQEIPTGQYTADCGVDITGHELFSSLLGDQELGVYVSASTADLEQARALIRYLAGFEP